MSTIYDVYEGETYEDGEGVEQEYYSKNTGFSSHYHFCEELKVMVQDEYYNLANKHRSFFSKKKVSTKEEYVEGRFPEESLIHTIADFGEEGEEINTFHITAALFGGIFNVALQRALRRFPSEPCTLPFVSETENATKNALPELESQSHDPHQSKEILINTNNDDQTMEIDQQQMSSTSGGNNTCKQPKSQILDKNSMSSSKSHEQSSSKPRPRRKQRSGPRLIKILTGKPIVDKSKVKDILVYDVPATWDEEKILFELISWGTIIQLSSKIQRKYQTLKVKVELAEQPLQAYLRGDWIVSLGGIPVRWFPAEYTLKERKQRERFVLVVNNVPDTMTNENLFTGAPCQFLTNAEVKAFKLIKNLDGSRKLLGYYDTFDIMRNNVKTQQTWGSQILTWDSQEPFNMNKRNSQNSKGKAFTTKKNPLRDQNSKKKMPAPKNKKNKKSREDRSHKKKNLMDFKSVLVDILKSLS